MEWIHSFQLFLFDFDGVLVNTEELHYKAYKKMCADRGFSLKWDLSTYAHYAMYRAEGLQEGIYKEFPALKQQEPDWSRLYQEKKDAYFTLLKEGVELIPGVEKLLLALEEAGISRCVVTNSVAAHIALIREQIPVLNTIPHWITREDYEKPKPDPECYHKAIELYSRPGDRVVGFEDSPKGLKALLETDAFLCRFFLYFSLHRR